MRIPTIARPPAVVVRIAAADGLSIGARPDLAFQVHINANLRRTSATSAPHLTGSPPPRSEGLFVRRHTVGTPAGTRGWELAGIRGTPPEREPRNRAALHPGVSPTVAPDSHSGKPEVRRFEPCRALCQRVCVQRDLACCSPLPNVRLTDARRSFELMRSPSGLRPHHRSRRCAVHSTPARLYVRRYGNNQGGSRGRA